MVWLNLARFIHHKFQVSIAISGSDGTNGRCEDNPFHRIGFQTRLEKVYGSFDSRANYVFLHKRLCQFNTKFFSVTISKVQK